MCATQFGVPLSESEEPAKVVRVVVLNVPPLIERVPPALTVVVSPTTNPLLALSVSEDPKMAPGPTATLIGPAAPFTNVFVPETHASESKKRWMRWLPASAT